MGDGAKAMRAKLTTPWALYAAGSVTLVIAAWADDGLFTGLYVAAGALIVAAFCKACADSGASK